MPPIPLLSGREVVKVFESLGWSIARQRASHIMMSKPGEAIPDHKEVGRGTLRDLIRDANLTIDEFLAAI
jgi:predicted RNA binding protein YcfA (HicA-like mRNA interferase family)